MKTLRLALAVFLSLVFISPVLAQGFRGGQPPSATILSPTEKVDISGKDTLKFKWYQSGSSDIYYLEFKLYKGYPGTGELIYQDKLFGTGSSLELRSDLFEDGASYTLQLRAISREGFKSDYSFDTFRVIKK
jgi:hypothetical protein